ncbi:protein FIZZY-RELATED 2-like [Populus alba x Populus x berolinensis]|nr:protein FIZZY-RELATED 2-like [Populus alba x Populus x berolinensis]
MADPMISQSTQSQLNIAASTTPRHQHRLHLENPTPSPSSSKHVNRLINSNHYISPSRPIFSDRFIPCRSSSNFALFNISLPQPSATAGISPGCGGKEDNPSAYAALLRNALFGPQTPDKKDWGAGAAGQNIFRYKMETRQSLHSLSPFGFDDMSDLGVSNVAIKTPRKVSRSPYKVLDAPALQDDFYLNLVDWSSHNVLAVGLGNCVYLWNACSSKVTKLCDLGNDDGVCSVGWAHRGTHLAIGTSNGKVQIWDASRCKRIRTMEGHRLRVGALAWSSSMLSSGSRDKSILQRDIRAREDFVSKLSGHKSEVGLPYILISLIELFGQPFYAVYFGLRVIIMLLHASQFRKCL